MKELNWKDSEGALLVSILVSLLGLAIVHAEELLK